MMSDYENYEPLDPHTVCRRILREKDWEIQLLRAERDECQRLLREAVLRDGLCDERWFREAKEAGGDDATQ